MSKNQDGFSVLEGLMVMIIVLLVGFIGYYVWNANHKSDVQPTSSNNSSATTANKAGSSTPTTTSATKDSSSYLTVTEWSVKIPISSETKALSYKITNGSSTNGDTGIFTSSTLTDIPGCSSQGVTVVRGTKDQFVPQESGVSTTTYETQYNNTKSGMSYYIGVKVGNYYYVNPNYRGSSCVSNGADLEKETAAIQAVETAIRKMVSL